MLISTSHMNVSKTIDNLFNHKDIQSFMHKVDDNIVGIRQSNNEVEFSSKKEMETILKDLFKVNPNLKCTIKHEFSQDPFLIIHIHFSHYACGVTLDTVWTCKIENNLIQSMWFTH